MGSVSTIYNGVRKKLAGRALMDVAFSNTSTNGVQNKVIKAKFDEVDSKLTNQDITNTLTISKGTDNNSKITRYGNVVQFYIIIANITTTTAWEEVASLGIKPVSGLFLQDGWQLATNGKLVNPNVITGGYANVSGTYLTND